MKHENDFLKWRLFTTVFFAGSVLMIYELVGTRVTSPLIGSSLYVWTAIIGSILGCLSVGNYLGGWLADRSPHAGVLAAVLLWAAFFVGLTNWFADLTGTFLNGLSLVLELKAVLLSLILFGPASLFLGMVSPYVVKLSLLELQNSGKQVGLIYMLSTLGSIVGTFLAGFLLIPLLGTEQLILLMAFLLLVLSLVVDSSFSWKKLFMVLTILILATFRWDKFSNNQEIDVDTAYQRVKIFDFFYPGEKQSMIAMSFDKFGIQSLKYVDNYKLVGSYLKIMQAYKSLIDRPEQVLFIGGAGYTMPSYLLHEDSSVLIDVVEIDPQMTVLAKKYFGLIEDSRLKSIHLDGRFYLNQMGKKYDLVMLDAFGGEGFVPPFHLITMEAFSLVKEALSEDGLLVLNVISPLEGKNQLLASVHVTLDSVFEDVLIFGAKTGDPLAKQNVILIAGKKQLVFDFAAEYEYSDLIQQSIWSKIPNEGQLLTDNYAPVEFLERLSRI